MNGKRFRSTAVLMAAILLWAVFIVGCSTFQGGEESGYNPAEQAYVPVGKLDKHYAFISGGQNGSVFVYGIPSGRFIRTIPIFEPEGSYGYAIQPGSPSWERLKNTGGFWGDVHHPVLSETEGKYDGKYLFAHDKANNRVARISLETFETEDIKNVPNIQGAHGLSVLSPNSKLLAVNGEFRHEITSRVPNEEDYQSMVAFLDPMTLETKFQILVPGQADINDSSKDGKWMFTTIYNIEKGLTITEMIQSDEDAIAAFKIAAAQKAVENGEYTEINGVPVIDPEQTSQQVMYMLPVPKNPHGCDVDPTGSYVMGSGKLSPTVSVYDISRIDQVDNPEDALAAEPRLGLGPLHTTFDNKGNAYTSMFIDSQIVKWNIEKAVQAHKGQDVDPIEDKIDVHYNVGHTQAMEAESADPAGDYLLALNKLSKDQYLPVGPSMPESQELIDIRGDRMEMIISFPAEPEPHDAVFMRADRLADKVKQKGEGEDHPDAVAEGESRMERTGPNSVHVYMTAVRSEYGLEKIRVKQGDKVTFTVTNIERVKDVSHGFAVENYGLNVALDPGQTKTFTIKADKPGTHWYYCTWFCSALHLEMRGRMIVEPAQTEMAQSSS